LEEQLAACDAICFSREGDLCMHRPALDCFDVTEYYAVKVPGARVPFAEAQHAEAC
jgi:hypothetical protein